MKEKIENKMITNDDLELLLDYLYSYDPDVAERDPKSALISADKYDILPLKIVSEELLEDKMTEENFLEFLLVAEKYNCAQLKRKGMAFVKSKGVSIAMMDKWQDQLKQNPNLLYDIYFYSLKI